MAEPEPMPPRENPEVVHEAADINTKAVAGFAIGLLIIAVVIHFALYWLLFYYRDREVRRWEPATLVERKDEPTPEPRLQVAPQADLAELRAAEERVLHSYGWIDREQNIVRIPIDRAMEIIAQKGLPVRKQAAEKQQAFERKTQSQKSGR